MPMDHSQMDHDGQPMPMGEHGGHMGHMEMTGALGPYPMEREASGTAWQPDTSEHMGLHDHERRLDADGPRRAEPRLRPSVGPARRRQGLRAGMLMGMARRPLGNGTLQFKRCSAPTR